MNNLKTILIIACAIVIAVLALKFIFFIIPIVIIGFIINFIYRAYNPKPNKLKTYNKKNNLKF